MHKNSAKIISSFSLCFFILLTSGCAYQTYKTQSLVRQNIYAEQLKTEQQRQILLMQRQETLRQQIALKEQEMSELLRQRNELKAELIVLQRQESAIQTEISKRKKAEERMRQLEVRIQEVQGEVDSQRQELNKLLDQTL